MLFLINSTILSLPMSSLKGLSLNGANIENEGTAILGNVLSINQALSYLSLADNNI